MLVLLAERPKELIRFRAKPWPFQQTFKTPLKNLPRFVKALLALFPSKVAVLSTDEVVIEPKNIMQFVASASISVENPYNFTLKADGKLDVAKLLEAALGDWIDFVFVPTPESYAIYADHDEFTTFIANTKGK